MKFTSVTTLSDIGAAVDLSGVTKGTLNGLPVDTTAASFTAGPRFTWNHGGRWVPYGQVLVGGPYATTSTGTGVLPFKGAIVPPGIMLPPGTPFFAGLGNVGGRRSSYFLTRIQSDYREYY